MTLSSKVLQNKTYVLELKQSTPCKVCGVRFNPHAMEFDHRDPDLKYKNISVLVGTGADIEVLKEEISKCDILCSNCHQIRTITERHSSRPKRRSTTLSDTVTSLREEVTALRKERAALTRELHSLRKQKLRAAQRDAWYFSKIKNIT